MECVCGRPRGEIFHRQGVNYSHQPGRDVFTSPWVFVAYLWYSFPLLQIEPAVSSRHTICGVLLIIDVAADH